MTDGNQRQSLPLAARERYWWWEWEAAALGVLVIGIFFTRMTAVPVIGEESRWAAAAREMIATGDWIVPRQQGVIFPERPPMSAWAMAVVGLARGDVDLVAVRLPSALAILLLAWLMYAYARRWMSRLASFSAAAAFVTMGQVLQLGRCGESEAVFTLFVAGSLLVWHLGYLSGWSQALTWSLGYALAALAALVKGPQAPVYFVSVTGAFLLLKRDWRWLFSRGQLYGMGCFALVVGTWLAPFALRCGWRAVDDIWTHLAEDRFRMEGLLAHLATYPLETFVCLLPWSPVLFMLLRPSVRRSLWAGRPQVLFLVVALAVTYPTVWIAAAARGRYFMPLYPCIALLVGLVVEHCVERSASAFDRRAWRHFLIGVAVMMAASGAGLAVVSLLPADQLRDARQPLGFLLTWIAAAGLGAGVTFWAARSACAPRPQIAVLALAAFAGLAYAGAVVNGRIHGGNDLALEISQLKRELGEPGRIVSLDRVYHRFAYEFGEAIPQIAWPDSAGAVPANVDYFCMDRNQADVLRKQKIRHLPFEWDVVAEIACDPVQRREPQSVVVIGRVRRPEVATRQEMNPVATRPDVNPTVRRR